LIVTCPACGQELGRVDDAHNGRIAGRSIAIRNGHLEIKCRGCDTYQPFPATVTLAPPSRRLTVRVSGIRPAVPPA